MDYTDGRFFTAENVLASPEEFGEAVTAALTEYNEKAAAGVAPPHGIYWISRLMRATVSKVTEASIETQIQQLYPNAESIHWDVTPVDEGGFSLDLIRIELSDGHTVTSFSDDAEDYETAEERWQEVQETFLGLAYNLDNEAVAEGSFIFSSK